VPTEESDVEDDEDEDEFVGALLDELSALRTAVRPLSHSLPSSPAIPLSA